ncbi:hypothetical protein [Bacteroides caccae]|uniref:hypothetical protein n=1 Tax=Bacteroides caccae TaxID=47678 RepID=UPI003569EA14
MEKNKLTIEQMNHAIDIIEDFQSDKTSRDFNRLNEILPLVLSILKNIRTDMEQECRDNKFYAPAWVDILLVRLSSNDEPLSDIEYNSFRSLVESLTVNDYKTAASGLNRYKIKYITPQEISEIVIALKHYFKFL